MLGAWSWCPWRGTFWLSRALATLLRLLVFLTVTVASTVLSFALLVMLAQIPVALIALMRPLLPAWAWLVLWSVAGVMIPGFLLIALVTALRVASDPEAAARSYEGMLTRYVVPRAAGGGGYRLVGWGLVARGPSRLTPDALRGALVHSRSGGAENGRGDRSGWVQRTGRRLLAVALLFGEHLFNTALLGLPGSLVPTPVSAIVPAGTGMTVLLVLVDILWAVGLSP